MRHKNTLLKNYIKEAVNELYSSKKKRGIWDSLKSFFGFDKLEVDDYDDDRLSNRRNRSYRDDDEGFGFSSSSFRNDATRLRKELENWFEDIELENDFEFSDRKKQQIAAYAISLYQKFLKKYKSPTAVSKTIAAIDRKYMASMGK